MPAFFTGPWESQTSACHWHTMNPLNQQVYSAAVGKRLQTSVYHQVLEGGDAICIDLMTC